MHVCVCLRCELLAFEAALAVCRQNVGQGVRGKERVLKNKKKRPVKKQEKWCLSGREKYSL